MLSNHSEAKFRARLFWLDTDGLIELETWDDKLSPIDHKKIPAREWVELDFKDLCNNDWIKEQFELTEGGWEILFEGKIESWQDGYPSEEWDSEITVVSYQKQKLPDDWFNSLNEKFLDLQG